VLEQGITHVMNKNLDARKNLRLFLQDNMEKMLDENYNKLKEFIIERIDAEKCYINYDDDDFTLIKPYIITDEDPEEDDLHYLSSNFGINSNLFKKDYVYQEIKNAVDYSKKKVKKNKHIDLYEDEEDFDPWDVEFEVNISKGISGDDYKNIMSMKRVIHSYFCILKKEFKANVPKYIVKFLVRSTIDNMRTYLQMAMNKHKDPMELVSEDPEVRTKREISRNSLKQLKIAMRAIKSVKRGKGTIEA
jgi:hypothetical protein